MRMWFRCIILPEAYVCLAGAIAIAGCGDSGGGATDTDASTTAAMTTFEGHGESGTPTTGAISPIRSVTSQPRPSAPPEPRTPPSGRRANPRAIAAPTVWTTR